MAPADRPLFEDEEVDPDDDPLSLSLPLGTCADPPVPAGDASPVAVVFPVTTSVIVVSTPSFLVLVIVAVRVVGEALLRPISPTRRNFSFSSFLMRV